MSEPAASAVLQELSLARVAARCAEETESFFQHRSHDPHFCFELFRRAIQERNEQAWQRIHRQYQTLLTGWIKQHPAFPASGETVAYLVNRTLEKMWVGCTSDKFSRFPDLASLLRYMQMCAHSSVIDHVRAAGPPSVELDTQVRTPQPGMDVEARVVGQAARAEFWEWLNTRLNDARERQAVYGSFVLELKPREVCALYPETFHNVDEVYLVKQNVLDRLRRDAELKNFLDLDA